ncbi:hypothetical protein BDF19DRAFT_136354 [Syncephalis fuscata]|nr:hypothetical protein BDF19DRAFT_136354 [Syncephalis fuscata]
MDLRLPAGDGISSRSRATTSHEALSTAHPAASLASIASIHGLSSSRLALPSGSSSSVQIVMPKAPTLRVLQSGGDVQVINVHFETHNDSHVLIKLLGFCVVVVLLLITVFVFFGNGTFLDSSTLTNGSRSSVSKTVFANYRSIAAAIWLIWYGVFCFWCWFARLAWGDIAVPEKCVIGFRRVRERSVVCWLPSTANHGNNNNSNNNNNSVVNHSMDENNHVPPLAHHQKDSDYASSTRWQLRIARPVNN